MVIHEGYENLKLVRPTVTIGIFDGVHLGHRALLARLVAMAGQVGGESAVITFDPHPRLVLSEKTERVSYLSTLSEKMRLMEDTFIDHLIIIRFDKNLASMEASDFIREILVRKIMVKHLLVGYDNHIGKNKKGDLNKIRESADMYDFTVEQINEISLQNEIISSTSIREALLNGRIAEANKWLGYSYSITGNVIEGRKLGRSFGFPTANIQPDDSFKLVPANGVYAVEVVFNDMKLPAMLSIGFNPTVNKAKGRRSIEVHIFDFDNNLYGQTITVIFRYKLRDEKKYENVRQLADQMQLDRLEALRLLS